MDRAWRGGARGDAFRGGLAKRVVDASRAGGPNDGRGADVCEIHGLPCPFPWRLLPGPVRRQQEDRRGAWPARWATVWN